MNLTVDQQRVSGGQPGDHHILRPICRDHSYLLWHQPARTLPVEGEMVGFIIHASKSTSDRSSRGRSRGKSNKGKNSRGRINKDRISKGKTSSGNNRYLLHSRLEDRTRLDPISGGGPTLLRNLHPPMEAAKPKMEMGGIDRALFFRCLLLK